MSHLKVSVVSHKDGDNVVILRVPWYYELVTKINDFLFCPCHGLSGLICRIHPKIEELMYQLWQNNPHQKLTWKKERYLLKLPIEHSCDVTKILWPDDDMPCWHKDEE